jgi:hypothetical protein
MPKTAVDALTAVHRLALRPVAPAATDVCAAAEPVIALVTAGEPLRTAAARTALRHLRDAYHRHAARDVERHGGAAAEILGSLAGTLAVLAPLLIANRSAASLLDLEASRSGATIHAAREKALAAPSPASSRVLAASHPLSSLGRYATAGRTAGFLGKVWEPFNDPDFTASVSSSWRGQVLFVPARFEACQHPQPFEAGSVVAGNTGLCVCPICDQPRPASSLVEDPLLRAAFARFPSANAFTVDISRGTYSPAADDEQTNGPLPAPASKAHRTEA